MNNKTAIIVICVCLSVITILSCCSNASDRVTEGVYFSDFGTLEDIPEGESSGIKLITSVEESDEIIWGLSEIEDFAKNYDEKYFSKNDLLLVTFHAGASYSYYVKSLSLNDNALKVIIDQEKPKDNVIYELLGVFKTAFISFEKGYLPEDVKFDITINEWDK